MNAAERASNAAVAVTANPSRREMVVATPEPNSGPASAQTAGAAHANALASKTYTFDGVFGPDATQAEVYESAIEPIVLETLEGFNCTVFAYGQTGTGKTHTMEGAGDEKKEKMERFSDTPNASSASLASNDAIPTNAGIVPRALRQIFSHLANTTTEYSVKCTFLELYNEEITDLLSDDGDEKSAESSGVGDDLRGKRSHRLMEDGRGGVSVEGLTEVTVKNVQDALRLAKTGSGRRKKAATLCNKHSSRSHSVFSIAVTTRAPSVDEEGEDLIKIGKLNLVDLAGSERIAKTGASGERLKEATKINLSLSTLCHVISSLTDPKASYIPYRDSKLTRLLQDSLGGNTKTVMIANVGPADYNYDETMNTLRYASRAKNIQNKPRINEDPKDALLREYQEEITKLKEQLNALNQGKTPDEIMAMHGVIGNTVQEKEVFVEDKEKMREFEERLAKEKEQIREKAEEERKMIENQANLKEEEKKKLIEELHKQEEEKEKAKTKQQKLVKKLQKMKEKMLVGSQVIEVAKAQQKELKKTRKQLAKEQQQQAELQMKLQEEEEEATKMQQNFLSL